MPFLGRETSASSPKQNSATAMKSPKNSFLPYLFGALTVIWMGLGNVQAVNPINLTGYWQDDNGNFIEIERNGPDAVAIMRSEQGRDNWMRGAMDLSGSDIYLVKKRGTRTVGTLRGELVRNFGNTRIRWNSGRIWKKSSQSDFNASLHDHDHSYGHFGGGAPALQGRWQSSDRTVIDIRQDGQSLSVRVISQQNSGIPRQRWTSAHGQIADSRLSLDCFHGTSLSERVTGRYVSESAGKVSIVWSNGQTWHRQPGNFGVITAPVVAVGRVPFDVVGSVIPSRATSVWQSSDGGYFRRQNDARWHEYSREGEIRNSYRETSRTDISVTLFDDRRGISLNLQKDECWFRQRGSDDWRRLSNGQWSSGSPTGTRPPSSNRPGQRHGPSQSQQRSSGDPVRIGGNLGSLLQGLFGR
jgi:hypothetical protein